MNNPFDLENYKPQISMRDLNTAKRNSFQQSVVVNQRRAAGVEPSLPYSDKGMDTEPTKFAIDMPTLPRYDKNAAARRRRAEGKK